ncbi:MAG: hypothetical protein AAB655_01145 [Patescibacteria group bacterium]|mgnify:CR=1 FL=1
MFIDTSSGDVKLTVGFGEYSEMEFRLEALTEEGKKKLKELEEHLSHGPQPIRFSWFTPGRQTERAGEFFFALT